MRNRLLLFCTLLVCAGCHHSPAGAVYNTPPFMVAGQWSFGSGSRGPDILAGLVDTATGVNGTATVYGCGEKPEQTEVTGNVSRDGYMTLQTAMMKNGIVLNLEGRLSADGATFVGSVRSSLFAYCESALPTSTRGQREPLADGVYAGELPSSSGDSKLRAIISVQQHTPFGPGGRYPVSSSISLLDPPCTGNISFHAQQIEMSGEVLTAIYAGFGGQGQTVITLKAVLVQSGSFLQVLDIAVAGGPCDKFHGSGSLTLDLASGSRLGVATAAARATRAGITGFSARSLY